MSGRSKRDTKSKLDKLAEYRLAREAGGRSKQWKPEDDADIYDSVTDEQYKGIVKGRLQRDDFVIDDGVGGYTDNGMDDWEEKQEEESEEEVKKPSKASKKKSAAKKASPPPRPAPNISAYRRAVSPGKEHDLMASILNDLDNVTTYMPETKKRKSSPQLFESLQPTYRSQNVDDSFPSSDPPDSIPTSDDDFKDSFSPIKRQKTTKFGFTPAADKFAKMDVEEDVDYDASFDASFDGDYLNDIQMEDLPAATTKIKPDAIKPLVVESKKPNVKTDPPSWLSMHASLAVTEPDTLGPLSASTSANNQTKFSVLEEDGSFRFFWLDYLEQDGKIYFIGKVRDQATGAWISCCVAVENIERNLYVLPRPRRLGSEETDLAPDHDDVESDFEDIRRQFDVRSCASKWVKRKYAFGEEGVPIGESEWLKVVYGFDQPQIKGDMTSPNIARIFGANTSAFELLVLKRKIMGPCWLQVKCPQLNDTTKGVSWCKLEVTVSDPKDINPLPDGDSTSSKDKDMPPLTVMSLSIRTIVNHQENKQEIVCASARIWTNMAVDDPTPPDQLPCSVHTYVRPLDKFPPNFEAASQSGKRRLMHPVKSERLLLNSLLVTIQKADPDVIVGHEFLGVQLDVLLHRMRELKADHWSRISRFRRSKWPNIGRQGTNLKFLNGRMLCDLASDGAKSMITSVTWSLTEMCTTHLNCERQDIDPDDTAAYFDSTVSSPDRLITFVQHCELDAHFQMAIAAKVQILPLTKQLTNLAGNSWNNTLNRGRAERNEYILLHEFHRLKYICPDKVWGKKNVAQKKASAEDDDEAGTAPATKGKRDKYKGGLVFEPKRGLWDKYVLVMDFNSLYPSIIQEYNIDFTTVDRVEDDENGEERIPEPPSAEVSQGVLPRLIATLVSRRRQVKSLMKDRSVTPAKYLQYDIKQMALKLTANSMYGCLGFEHSRFFARPLAALTTFKGREILTHTRELAESLSLDVLYGDTDSIFVNSNATDLPSALKIANEFKKLVNDRYKLLEIDLDGVFQRLLLLQKKKYAAIKAEEGGRTSTEVKGLDMKRREYCALSKNVSSYVLQQILSGEATEVVVEHIHEYLTTVGENVRSGTTPKEDFIIFKRLGKNPEDYPDAKSQPHVQVALRMKAKGGTARAGDVIPYIFCHGGDDTTSKAAQADKAHHPDDVRKEGSDLKIDFEYYLSQQVLPPIERLCDAIEGTDRARLADCLGLDPGRYRQTTSTEQDERLFGTLDSQIPDKERFKDADELIVRCRKCKTTFAFPPVADRDTPVLTSKGPVCLNEECKAPLGTAGLQLQLEQQIRQHISKYYEGWMLCDDPICDYRGRMTSVYGRRCLRPDCRGVASFEYSDLHLYNQLLYYSSLFNSEKILNSAKGSHSAEEVQAVVGLNNPFLLEMSETVDRYLSHCGRRWVELNHLFSFMKVS
ncbi:DNA polymerase alpha catalytic subunit [Sistotremastrum niveocremeum HHB9708]|uniref:DNA polymerase n=1 Tax=Sistotremastrum niveocremeum HHB9708 TaxID=1314777 RepID=A0A164VVJ5_9AGAM|nr:DNA polymerase alpha catalytic subunit [Sistotremastrum niveocremeum HHB9708]